jgi:hypothetical protein
MTLVTGPAPQTASSMLTFGLCSDSGNALLRTNPFPEARVGATILFGLMLINGHVDFSYNKGELHKHNNKQITYLVSLNLRTTHIFVTIVCRNKFSFGLIVCTILVSAPINTMAWQIFN